MGGAVVRIGKGTSSAKPVDAVPGRLRAAGCLIRWVSGPGDSGSGTWDGDAASGEPALSDPWRSKLVRGGVFGCETRRGDEAGRLAVRRPTDGALIIEPGMDGVGCSDGTDSPMPEDSIIRLVLRLNDPAIFLS